MDRTLKTATVLILCLFAVIVLEGSYITPGFPPGGVTNSTPVTVSAATTNDQQMMELALPAGFLNSLGKSFDIFSAGFYTLPATASLTHKIKLCTVSGCGSGTVVTLYSTAAGSSAGSVTNSNWSMRAVAITATAGASGNLEVHGRTMIELTAPNTPVTPYQDANTTVSSPNIDLTAALFLDFTVAFSTSSVSNTAIQRSGSITPQAAGAAAGGGGSGGSSVTVATPYITVSGTKYVSATMWPFTAFFSGSFLDANTSTLTAGANGSENINCNCNSVNSWYSVASTVSIEAEFQFFLNANANSSGGIWICDSTNGKLYSFEITVNSGAPAWQFTSWTLAACSGTPSAPSVVLSSVASNTGIAHFRLLKTGGNLIASISQDGGQTYSQFSNANAVGAMTKAGVDLRGSSAALLSSTFLSTVVN